MSDPSYETRSLSSSLDILVRTMLLDALPRASRSARVICDTLPERMRSRTNRMSLSMGSLTPGKMRSLDPLFEPSSEPTNRT